MDTPDDKRLEALVAEIELPPGAYDKAVKRYEDLGEWFDRLGSLVKSYSPHISAQGSFALGTATYPLNRKEDYDLDLTCKLRSGISRASHTQFDLKELVRTELEEYRKARQIQEPLDEKRRCWRLFYKDSPGFHLDTVPGIPADEARRSVLMREMRAEGVSEGLLGELSADAIWITDNETPGYRHLTPDWLSSNPAGYVRWFRSRLSSMPLLEQLVAKVDDVPVYRRKTPLQKVIQLLKRHRDVMFERLPDSKPVSAIITTLAAKSYRPGEGLGQTLATILQALDDFRRSDSDTVCNPVNPKENFADKWAMPECAEHFLKQNFHHWVEQAVADFGAYARVSTGAQFVTEAGHSLRVVPDSARVALAFGTVASGAAPAERALPRIEIQDPPKPWWKG
jgi:hypothetical protein